MNKHEEREHNRLVRIERTKLNNEALRETTERLNKIFEAHNVQLLSFAEDIKKNRTTLFNYLNGNTEINEITIKQIGDKFSLYPLEVRYRARKYRENELEEFLIVIESYIDSKITLIPSIIRARVVTKCYSYYLDKLIDFEPIHSADIINKADELLDMYQIGLQHGGSGNDSEPPIEQV